MHSALFECPQPLFLRFLTLVQLFILCSNTPVFDSCFCLLTTGSCDRGTDPLKRGLEN